MTEEFAKTLVGGVVKVATTAIFGYAVVKIFGPSKVVVRENPEIINKINELVHQSNDNETEIKIVNGTVGSHNTRLDVLEADMEALQNILNKKRR